MDKIDLYTALDLENILGKKYFYRQSIYRLSEETKISTYQIDSTFYFSKKELVEVVLNRLAHRISHRYHWVHKYFLRIKYDKNKLDIYGFPKGIRISINTNEETEEDLLNKFQALREEVIEMDIPIKPSHHGPDEHKKPDHHEHHKDHGGHHGHNPEPHREIMDALRRIEERLERLEEK